MFFPEITNNPLMEYSAGWRASENLTKYYGFRYTLKS
jgi:hypothetical protein